MPKKLSLVNILDNLIKLNTVTDTETLMTHGSTLCNSGKKCLIGKSTICAECVLDSSEEYREALGELSKIAQLMEIVDP